MTTADDIQTTGEAITKFGSAINASAGTLGKLSDMTATAAKLSKLSAGLGALGAGLGLVATLAGAKSDTDRVLDAIGKLSAQIETLNQNMDHKFAQLESVVEKTSAQTQLFPHRARLIALTRTVEAYRQDCARDPTSADTQVGRGHLRDFDSSDSRAAATAIHLCMTESAMSSNILDAVYKTSIGDAQALGDIGGALFTLLMSAYVSEVLIESLGPNDAFVMRQDQLDAIQRDADEFYSPLLVGVSSAWGAAVDKCYARVADNVGPKARDLMTGSGFPTDHSAAADYLCSQLSDHFDGCDFLVLVYNDVSGYDHHSCYGYNVEMIFHTQGVNVVVKWVDKTLPPMGQQYNTVVTESTPLTPDQAVNLGMGHPRLPLNLEDLGYPAPFIASMIGLAYPGMIWLGDGSTQPALASRNPARHQFKRGAFWTISMYA